MKIVVVSGGFDPLHSGHIRMFAEAARLGDRLVVAVNSDDWLERKKGRAFMPLGERANIIQNLSMVDEVITGYNDSDNSSCAALQVVKNQHPDAIVIFANGGDRTSKNIPEMSVPGITFAFGVGGQDKTNSSSCILEEWRAPKTLRPWGYYRVLHEVPGAKVKELTIDPGQSLSMQCHSYRSEYWLVTSGHCKVEKEFGAVILEKHQSIPVNLGQWHQLSNPFDEPCKLVEIQYGVRCDEDDIERR